MKAKLLITVLLASGLADSVQGAIGRPPTPEMGVSILKLEASCEQNDELCSAFARKAKALWLKDGARAITESQDRGSDPAASSNMQVEMKQAMDLEKVSLDSFALNQGIRLGMSEEEVTNIMGKPSGETTENDFVVRTYKDMKQAPCETGYLAKYSFKDKKLRSYKIECDVQ